MRKFILDKAPNDCRSTQAISEGYQLINNKYYKLGPSKTNHATAVANCGSAGARLVLCYPHYEKKLLYLLSKLISTGNI